MKTINQSFDNADFYKLQEIKNRSGLSWDVFIIKAAKEYSKNKISFADNGDADE